MLVVSGFVREPYNTNGLLARQKGRQKGRPSGFDLNVKIVLA